MKTLNPLDATWLYVDSARTPMHVANLSIYSMPENAPDNWFSDIVANLRQTRHFAAPFNLKLTSPRLKSVFPTWSETTDIDIDYHFRHSALPKPGGERELGVLISRLHSHPMDFTRPLWECHLIEGLENNRFALYVKVHHSLVDGVGGMRMLTKMLSFDPAARDLPPPWSVGTGRDGPRPPREGAGRTPMEKLRLGLQRQSESLPELSRAFGDLARQAGTHQNPDWVLPFEGPQVDPQRQGLGAAPFRHAALRAGSREEGGQGRRCHRQRRVPRPVRRRAAPLPGRAGPTAGQVAHRRPAGVGAPGGTTCTPAMPSASSSPACTPSWPTRSSA